MDGMRVFQYFFKFPELFVKLNFPGTKREKKKSVTWLFILTEFTVNCMKAKEMVLTYDVEFISF